MHFASAPPCYGPVDENFNIKMNKLNNKKLASFVLYLKIINTFKKICASYRKLSKEPQKRH